MQEVYATIAELPEDFRLALVAVDVLGLSYREAARALNVREATLTTRLFRARKQVAARARAERHGPGRRGSAADAPRSGAGHGRPGPGNECAPAESSRGSERPTMTDTASTQPKPSWSSSIRSIDARAPERAAPARASRWSATPGAQPRRRSRGAARSACALRLGAPPARSLRGGGGARARARPRRRRASRSATRDAAALTPARADPACAAESRQRPTRSSTAAVDGVSFPYWGRTRFGWRSGGRAQRPRRRAHGHDGLLRRPAAAGASATRSSRGTPAPQLAGGVVRWRSGTPYRLLTSDGAPVVTWLRDGHLCVVSGRGVERRHAAALASWDDAQGSVAS